MQERFQFVKDELGEARAEAQELRRLLDHAEARVRDLEGHSQPVSWYDWLMGIIVGG